MVAGRSYWATVTARSVYWSLLHFLKPTKYLPPDFASIDLLAHFDRERIPERVVSPLVRRSIAIY